MTQHNMTASQLQGIEISNDPTTGLGAQNILKRIFLDTAENYIKTVFQVKYSWME